MCAWIGLFEISRHGAWRRSVASHGRSICGSSWPGLSRPSTSFLAGPSTWMPGTRPGMTSGEVGRSITELPPSPLRREHATVMAGRGDEALLRTDVPAAARHGRAGDEALLRADVPAIHVLCCGSKDVDARHKAGHDEW